jgi:hypothetical protein
MLELASQFTENMRLEFLPTLLPIIDQLASQRFLLEGVEPLYLRPRIDQALQAWHLGIQPPRHLLGDLRPETIANLGHAVASVSSSAAAIEGEIVEPDEEPWLVARTEAVDRIADWLGSVHPRLAVKFKGMWHVVQSRGPDYASQAANSAVELIDHTLRTLAPEDDVIAWQELKGKYAKEVNPQNGRPHRSLRIRYIAERRAIRASSVDYIIKSVTGVLKDLQAIKHVGDDRMAPALSTALQGVEYCILMLMGTED